MKVGLNRSEDERRVKMVRQQIGDGCQLVRFISVTVQFYLLLCFIRLEVTYLRTGRKSALPFESEQ